MKTNTRQLGLSYEATAREFLVKHGLTYLYSNYACRVGEIDLIMLDQQQLVFVEVRFRRNMQYGGAIESITQSKQKKLIRTAEYFRIAHPQWRAAACRFDVMLLQGSAISIEWIQNAFL